MEHHRAYVDQRALFDLLFFNSTKLYLSGSFFKRQTTRFENQVI